MRTLSKKLVLTLALILVLSLSLTLVSSYPYSNYYGPSDNTVFKETKSVNKQESKIISDGDFYQKTSSSSSEKTSVERRTNNNDFFNSPQRSYFDDYYYSNHFNDYQPHYSYRQYGYYPDSRFSRPTVTYLSGDNPRYVGREHYYQDYYYQPQYDGHLGYYTYRY